VQRPLPALAPPRVPEVSVRPRTESQPDGELTRSDGELTRPDGELTRPDGELTGPTSATPSASA
jgi:hypothetical protein